MTPTQRTIRIEIDQVLPLQNQWQRWHYRKRGRYIRELALMIAYACEAPREPLDCVNIAITRVSNWRGIAPDRDAVCVKPLLDLMQPASKRHPYGLGFIADDSREVIKSLSIGVEKGKARTVVKIEEV